MNFSIITKNKKSIVAAVLSLMIVMPFFAFADSVPSGSGGGTSSNGGGTQDPTRSDFQLVPSTCYGSDSSASPDVKNQGKCGWRDLIVLLNVTIQFLAYIAASLSAIAFAYAGFLYMTAAGDSGKIEQAHGIFKKTFIGIFFVLVGWLLIATMLKILGVQQAFSLINLSGVKTLTQ